jgi:hypothetical protein
MRPIHVPYKYVCMITPIRVYAASGARSTEITADPVRALNVFVEAAEFVTFLQKVSVSIPFRSSYH